MPAQTQDKIETISLNGIEYVRKDSIPNRDPAVAPSGLPIVLIRTHSAGVHFGYLVRRDGKEVELAHARRVYYWDGAASLSQMAVSGVSKPQNCKFSVTVPSITLTEAIEVLSLTAAAATNLYGVKEWVS